MESNLNPELWIKDVKEELHLSKLSDLLVPGTTDDYKLQWKEFTFSDLEDEAYGDEKPYSVKVIDMGEHGREEDWGDFNKDESFNNEMLPLIEDCAKEANRILGYDCFMVTRDTSGGEPSAMVDFFFTHEEIPELQEKGMIANGPLLSYLIATFSMPTSLFAHAEPTFADFDGPLFEGATVDVREETKADGSSVPDPTSAKLELPNISAGEAERIPEKFQITVSKKFEDNKAMEKAYAFIFQVSEVTFEPLANGMVRPRFTANLKEYKHV